MSSIDRLSDVIFKSYNRFYYSKISGGLNQNEFSNLLENIGDLVANKVKQGKINEEEINDIISFLPTDEYFNGKHKNIEGAKKTFIESTYMALNERKNRFSFDTAPTNFKYTDGFKRL